MTHREVVDIAYRWLLKSGSVGFAFKELKSYDNQIPDVIGFGSWSSILIECKVSRSDFFADRKKPHHQSGMGNFRYYCCPAGLLKAEELPEKWGLIYVDEKGKCKAVRIVHREYEIIDDKVVYTNRFSADHEAEKRIMYTALRRLHLRGNWNTIYENPNVK